MDNEPYVSDRVDVRTSDPVTHTGDVGSPVVQSTRGPVQSTRVSVTTSV